MKMMKIIVTIFLLLIFVLPVEAQWMVRRNDRIHSMEMILNDDKSNVTVLDLSSNEQILFSFDDITKEYHRYVYTVEHCDYNWNKSTRIFESDYLRGSIRRIPIDDFEESLNTTVEYTHYHFLFPNNKLQIVYSGNYKIHVIDDDTNDEVCTFCFSVVENVSAVNASMTSNTEIDWNKTHQQLKMAYNLTPLNCHDVNREIKTVVVQNGRWDRAVWNPTPDYVTPSEVKWEHNRDLIFDGGNEFRKFEMTSVKTAMMGMDNIRWYRPFYHATLFPSEVAHNYIYNEDQNGRYYIRTIENADSDFEADYLHVHFFLKNPPVPQGDFYVFGGLTNWCIIPEAKMNYNNDLEMYETSLLLKQGYYNYQFVYIPKGTTDLQTIKTEGNFYQAENEYTILVYYTQKGSRYDRLVAVRRMSYSPTN